MEQDNTYWDEENQIAFATGSGIADLDSARSLLNAMTRMAQEHGGEVDWIIDLTDITSSSPEARKVLVEFAGHPSIRFVAIVGASPNIETVTRFINTMANQSNAQYFSYKDEAIEWIRNSRIKS